MDLRDRFAAHFAAALAHAFADAGEIARRAYDLAEAMLSERELRIDAEERSAIEMEPNAEPLDAFLERLDPEAFGDEELSPSWLDPPYDPSWDLDPKWSAEPPPAASSRPPGPGLTRTQPEEGDDRKERSA